MAISRESTVRLCRQPETLHWETAIEEAALDALLPATERETSSLSLSPYMASNQAILPSWGAEKTQSETPGLLLSLGNAADSGENPIQTTISYTYDSLYRLTDAVYSNGFEFHYTYDPVGNRLTQTTCAPGVPCSTTMYGYDAANRLTSVNGQAYTWDNNGNLLKDGTSQYAYDSQNRLTSLTQGGHSYVFSYNGNGDRLAQGADGAMTRYTLDLETGLTQVLTDGTYAYLYGADRLAQVSASETDYFLGDALGSVRQLVDANAAVRLAKNYDPHGSGLESAGTATSRLGFVGETQENGLVYLHSRYYAPEAGVYVTKDSWPGNAYAPVSYNSWLYVLGNPVNFTDPSGHDPWWCEGHGDEQQQQQCYLSFIEQYSQQSGPTGTPLPPTGTPSPTSTPSPTTSPTSTSTQTETPTPSYTCTNTPTITATPAPQLSKEQYIALQVFAETSDGSFPPEAIRRIAWVAWNLVAKYQGDPFVTLDKWGGLKGQPPTWDQTMYCFADACDKLGGPQRWPSMDQGPDPYRKGLKFCYDPHWDSSTFLWEKVNTDLSPNEKRLALWKAFMAYTSQGNGYYKSFGDVWGDVMRISAGQDTDPTGGAIGEYSQDVPAGMDPEEYAREYEASYGGKRKAYVCEPGTVCYRKLIVTHSDW